MSLSGSSSGCPHCMKQSTRSKSSRIHMHSTLHRPGSIECCSPGFPAHPARIGLYSSLPASLRRNWQSTRSTVHKTGLWWDCMALHLPHCFCSPPLQNLRQKLDNNIVGRSRRNYQCNLRKRSTQDGFPPQMMLPCILGKLLYPSRHRLMGDSMTRILAHFLRWRSIRLECRERSAE